jgi:hypothetical protein
LNAGTLAGGRSTHAIADLRSVHVELGEGAAEGVAMHTEFFGGFALVALVLGEHFKDVTLLELPNGLRVGNAGAVHLRNQTIEFALQGYSSLAVRYWNHSLILPLRVRLDPIGRVVFDFFGAIQDQVLKIVRYNEGYRMNPRKEIGR